MTRRLLVQENYSSAIALLESDAYTQHITKKKLITI